MKKLVALSTATLLFACAEDGFIRNEPALNVTIYDDGTYARTDAGTLLIDLGEVPLYTVKKAFYTLDNPTTRDLVINEVKYDPARTVSGEWLPATWRNDLNDLVSELPPFKVPRNSETRLLEIPLSPTAEGPIEVVAVIDSNAENGRFQEVKVIATGVFNGAPDIEIEYNGINGPNPSDCVDVDSDGVVDGCALTQPLDFGNIGLGAQGTARLTIRNKAECPDYPGAPPCSTCGLTVAADPTRQNLGLAFKAGTNDGTFAFAGSTATPFTVQQRDVQTCNSAGEVRLLLNFNAPTVDGIHTAVIVIESNDPDEPLIEIPVRAYARNAPVAIARFRAPDPVNPAAPYTDPNDIEPLNRVYFDGRQSYDPRDPTDPTLISAYRWEIIEYPTGTNPADFQMQQQNSSLFSFWLPLAGHYVVRLTVTNIDGIESGDTPESRIEFDCVPGDRMHIQLVWDDPSNDQDLHLTWTSTDDRVCNQPNDCHWLNKTPSWFPGSPLANPSLDIDDTNGLGPENINIDTPQPGTYRVYVHYYGDFNFSGTSPTRETIRIFLNGLQAAEYRRTLNVEKAVWAVATITWLPDGTGFVEPYPSDSPGEIGAVANMDSCTSPGWAFP